MSKPIFDNSGSNTSSAATSLSWNHTCSGNDRYLLVTLWFRNTVSSVAVTYNGVAMTLLQSSGVGATLQTFGLLAPDTGTHSVSVTWTTSRAVGGVSLSYTGVDQSNPIGTISHSTGTTDPDTVVVPVASSKDILVDCVAGYNSSNDTVPSVTAMVGQNIRATQNTVVTGSTATRQRASDKNGPSNSIGWNLSGQTFFYHIGVPLLGIPNRKTMINII